MSNEDLIPEEKFGRDHWSMLAYLETVAVDSAGFQVGLDAYMRHTRRHHRVMSQECPQPKRAKRQHVDWVISMEPEHGTRLKDGTVLGDHHFDIDLCSDGTLEWFWSNRRTREIEGDEALPQAAGLPPRALELLRLTLSEKAEIAP
jgi:hypothetical protein